MCLMWEYNHVYKRVVYSIIYFTVMLLDKESYVRSVLKHAGLAPQIPEEHTHTHTHTHTLTPPRVGVAMRHVVVVCFLTSQQPPPLSPHFCLGRYSQIIPQPAGDRETLADTMSLSLSPPLSTSLPPYISLSPSLCIPPSLYLSLKSVDTSRLYNTTLQYCRL